MSRTLTVYLAADLKKFSPQLQAAQNDLGRFGRATTGLSNTLSNMLGPALIGAGVAAGYAAVKFGVDGVQAFIEDEAAAAKLATTLDNLGLANDTTAVEANIDALQRQFGVADSLLRPAMDRLVRSIGDTTQATSTLKLAMDISAGTGKSLDAVVQALGRAYDGNTTGLSRLGAGLDKALLKTGDMDAITAQLAATFAGQAQTAANTYQGQLNRLAVGFDELKESFGAGFIGALGDSTDATDGLMQSMKDLQPTMEKLGGVAYETAEGFAQAAVDAASIFDAINKGDWRLAWQIIAWGEDSVAGYTQEVREAAAATYGLNNAFASMGGGDFAGTSVGQTLGQLRGALSGTVTSAVAAGAATATYGGILVDYGAKVTAATGSSSALNRENEKLTTGFELQRAVVDRLRETLGEQVTDLETATAAVKEYASTLAGQLLGGIDLGAAQQTGTDLGISTLEAFDQQIAQAEWFGNVLSTIKATGADQRLVDQLAALGPAAGGKLAQEMIDKGLVQTFSDRLADVISTANTTAQAMVPEFLTAGVDSAEQFVDGTVEQLQKEQTRLKAIGKNVGKVVGANLKAEIADAVAEAVRAAQAAKSAAAAERAAEIAAQQVVVSEQQIAQALSRLISNSNARAGFSMGLPTPSPVLG